VEVLEDRFLPSVSLNFMEYHDPSRIPAGVKPSPLGILPENNGTPFPPALLPADLQTAYGTNNIMFGSVVGDGSGQTIAIVDAYDDPRFVNSTASNFSTSDLAQFDVQAGLPDPPSFMKVNQAGNTSPLPGTDPAGAGNPNGNWEIEEALDIEYAHGIAPGASIVLVEANSAGDSDLFAAVATAANLPGVSAVSMSWGENEFSGQTTDDSKFVTPSGHQGVTFLASSGDSGGFAIDDSGNPTTTPGIDYPAASPNVVAVGGTSLVINADGTYNSETAWSGSGGGTSLFETEPAYQLAAQATNFRTTPDVAFDADPNTGVSVFDSYDNLDGSGPWIQVGGTSLAAPAWAGLIAIANQGRVLAKETTLDGPGQTLQALYAISPADFHDVTSGSNGVFSAGLGYDEVTGLGTPQAVALMADLANYGTASQIAVTSQPPSSVILGDSFGIAVAAENSAGVVDLAFSGTLTISLDANHPGAVLGGTLTATAFHGVAVFDGLTLNKLGTGYTLTVTSSSFPSITSNSFDVITNPTPWQGTFYPVSTDASLRAAITTADSNGFAFNTILLSASTYILSDLSSGGLVIENSSSLPSKTLTITGQGQSSTIIGSSFSWHDRIFEIEGSGGQSLNVVMQGLTIEGGLAENGGILGGNDALGGGLLIDDANVTLANVAVMNNKAQGTPGTPGAATKVVGAAGAAGGKGNNAKGGGFYLASGTLTLFNDKISGNAARGGTGGAGGAGGGQGTNSQPAVTGGPGGAGGPGGSAAGGGIYAASGVVLLQNDTFASNQARGGAGGAGGTGGSGGHGKVSPPRAAKPGGVGGVGGKGGPAYGGGIYLAGGSLTLTGSALQKNTAQGGAGGQGGHGGPGTALLTLTSIFGGGTTLTIPPFPSAVGSRGGSGGSGGAGGAGIGGGIYVSGGSLTLDQTTLANNEALGGPGGIGGIGGTGGFGAAVTTFGIPTPKQGGTGGVGGAGGAGNGGGIYAAGGTIAVYADTLNANVAQGGKGGTGGSGGSGPIAASAIVTVPTSGGSSALNSGGPGGAGGTGGTGVGGGLYVSGGVLTLSNDTVAVNSAAAGTAGTGGLGGHAGSGGNFRNLPGTAGLAGSGFGGGLFVNGGTLNLDNSTVALNKQTGTGSGGGAVVKSPGTVTAVSTIFASNGTVDFSGNVSATDSLFQTKPINGTLSGSGNLVQVDPMLNPNGLQNNGGPTQTIALQATSPAIGAGANPQALFADQRGYDPRTGPAGTDIGAYQTTAQPDTKAPTPVLQASSVTSSNASALNPYKFSVTYSDNVAVAVPTLPGAVIQVLPPGSLAPIPASVEGTAPVGTTDGIGDAQSFVVTYQITPPGGAWTSADNGTYTVALGGGAVADLAGNAVAAGSLGTFSVAVNKTSTTTTVASSVNPSTYGQSVTFTATVTAGSGTPVGKVNFKENGTIIATVTLDSHGQAVFTTSTLKVGNQNIQTVYTGSLKYSMSASPMLVQGVQKSATTTALASSLSPIVYGEKVTFTATVTAVSPGAGTPGGTVAFRDNGVTLATISLDASGVAAFTTSALSVGNDRIVAAYTGSSSYKLSLSQAFIEVVNKDTTSTALQDSPNPSVYGQSVTFTATVTANAPGSGIPGGTIIFRDNGATLATVSLNASGVATFTTSALTVGNNRIVAAYTGSGSFKVSQSAAVVEVVNKDATSTALQSSANPSVFGQSVTFTATVTAAAPGSGTPGGTVTFRDNGVTVATVALNTNGVATFTTSALGVGQHRIVAVYGGSSSYKFSQSTALIQVVNRDATQITLSSSVNPSVPGQPVTFTVKVVGAPPGSGVPTGTITFYDGSKVIDTASVDSTGTATFTISTLSVGSHNITATYSGDANYKYVKSAVLVQIVKAGASPDLAALFSLTLDKSAIDWLFAV
jgi:hypothetical protein